MNERRPLCLSVCLVVFKAHGAVLGGHLFLSPPPGVCFLHYFMPGYSRYTYLCIRTEYIHTALALLTHPLTLTPTHSFTHLINCRV
ncbi:hypothetical protein LZ30DRAFT_696794 [Colletotrichum cereale]|nr:hypothetical protein LZ30DRAFT_696794 [Colletotrichum cereale]